MLMIGLETELSHQRSPPKRCFLSWKSLPVASIEFSKVCLRESSASVNRGEESIERQNLTSSQFFNRLKQCGLILENWDHITVVKAVRYE